MNGHPDIKSLEGELKGFLPYNAYILKQWEKITRSNNNYVNGETFVWNNSMLKLKSGRTLQSKILLKWNYLRIEDFFDSDRRLALQRNIPQKAIIKWNAAIKVIAANTEGMFITGTCIGNINTDEEDRPEVKT